ncbi:MAG: hypothetical protein ACK56F_06900, partial [bacterium]
MADPIEIHRVEICLSPRMKPSGFVKLSVIRKMGLGDQSQNRPASKHRCDVVEAPLDGQWQSEDHQLLSHASSQFNQRFQTAFK